MTLLKNNFSAKPRHAFTLVELLVSLALIIFIMSLMSTLFVLATRTFRDLKAAGDLNDQLRSAGQVIRQLVKAPHFLKSETGQPYVLSDKDFWKPTKSDPTETTQSKHFNWRKGYLRVELSQNFESSFGAFDDFAGITLRRCGQESDHKIFMTSILPGNRPENLFSAYFPAGRPTTPQVFPVTPGQSWNDSMFEDGTHVNSRLAEVALFLSNTTSLVKDTGRLGESAGSSGGGDHLPLYDLHLATWLLNDTFHQGTFTAPADFEDKLSLDELTNNWNDLEKVTFKANRATKRFFEPLSPSPDSWTLSNRFPPSMGSPSNKLDQSLLLRNVISLEVNLLYGRSNDDSGVPFCSGAADFDKCLPGMTIPAISGGTVGFPARAILGPPFVFDTDWAQNQGRYLLPIAIRITIRVYDPDNEIARQMTIIEPL